MTPKFTRRAASRLLLGLPLLQAGLSGCQMMADSEPVVQKRTREEAFVRRTLEDIAGPNFSSLRELYSNEIHQVEFNGAALGRQLLQAWNAAGSRRFTIAHFGDSLMQQGIAAEMLRNKLQLAQGSAGRGMVFPFKIAKTYSHNDLSFDFTGNWFSASSMQNPPKLPVGISGFVAQTTDRNVSINLRFDPGLEPGAKKIRLLYRVTASGYVAHLRSAGQLWEMALPQSRNGSATSYVDFQVERLGEEVLFDIRNGGSSDAVFEVQGISIENMQTGVLHHNLGVGGAAFVSLLEQSYFEEQARWLAPDLVILDWGTNDIIYKNAIAPDLERIVVETIRKVRTTLPNALIMMTSPQDMYYKLKPVTASWDAAVLFRRLALENNCLFYDWYRAAGGQDAMPTWYVYKLGGTDHVHLNTSGYAVKGDLMAQAFLNTIRALETNPSLTRIAVSPTRAESVASVSAWLKAAKPEKPRPSLVSISPATVVL